MWKVNDAAHDATLTASYDVDRDGPRVRPARVGRYEVGEALGAGAMGVVYRAHDPELDRHVAIKVVRASSSRPSSRSRLLREAQAMARLRHPNVVPIFDVGPADDTVFVAMPLLEGGTLRSWLREGPRSLDAILDRFVAAGRGLAAAHAAGLVHRDFKPDNVLLGTDGEVHVADFGLARVSESEIGPLRIDLAAQEASTQTGEVVGTPAYMSSEQLLGRPSDARADQFSFCVALWEAVYGERPFSRPVPENTDPLSARLDAIAAGPVPPNRRDRPAWLAQVLARGLASTPEQRWPSMQALLDAIAGHRAPPRWPRWLAAGAGAVALAAALIAITRPSQPLGATPFCQVVPLTHRGDLKTAAISPDGDRLAFVVGDSLVLRGNESVPQDRVILEHGVGDDPIAWSPDGSHILISTPEIATLITTEVVDLDQGTRFKLPVHGTAAFLSSTEVAVTSARARSVSIFPAAEQAVALTTCNVPGEYTFLHGLVGMEDGTMVVETEQGTSHALVILGRDCRVRATFSAEPISGVAATDTGTVVSMVVRDTYDEIIEISLDGNIVSRRRITCGIGQVLGRRHGMDYVTTLGPKTHLERLSGGALSRLYTFTGNGPFSLAPDGETVVWIERDDHSQGPGPLWIAKLHTTMDSRAELLDNALTAGWSPDGRSLAVFVDDTARIAPTPATDRPGQSPSSLLEIVDRHGTVSRRILLPDVDREAAPVWLDDHRIAVQTQDHLTYHWFDLTSEAKGELTDRSHGAVYWLTRSPVDGTLAMWVHGTSGAADTSAEHLWIQPVGHAARLLRVQEAVMHFLVPSWSASGELLLRALDTGAVWKIALDTGELTHVAQLPGTPLSRLYDDHLASLPSGDLLAIERDLGMNVATVRTDAEPRAHAPPPALRTR